MLWWLNTDHRAFSVDNALVRGSMDFSSLPPDVWMVHWREGQGEIERQDAHGRNLNGLRERFTDLTPYLGFFRQFMRLLPGLTLAQARQVQTQLIGELYRSKRTAPHGYTVAAGERRWATDDATLTTLLMTALTADPRLGGGIEWTPLGATSSLPLTRFEVQGLMQGIAARTVDLQTIQAVKVAELEAMTSVAEVIDYDVTTGW